MQPAETQNSQSPRFAAPLDHQTAAAAPQLVRRLDEGWVRCHACGHACRVPPGRRGVCQVRFNDHGTLRVPFGYIASLQCDPIEKKPFHHALPGSEALSFGMLGCSLHCAYCQNWVTSQVLRDDDAAAPARPVTPQRLVYLASSYGATTLASTYNEPLITSEWAVEIFRLAKERGFRTAFISNGNATTRVLRYLRPWVDFFKVDLKSFRDRSYRKLGGRIDRVLATIPQLVGMGFWVEVVTPVVPGFNDDPGELRDLSRYLADVSPDIPWHATAFHKDYKMTAPQNTPAGTLIRACEIGRDAGLRYVYAGNLPGRVGRWEHTHCPGCDARVIARRGSRVLRNELRDGKCPSCGTSIAGVWS